MMAQNIKTCHACEFRQKTCSGKCPCTIDGRDIIDHARANDCPKKKFSGKRTVFRRVQLTILARPETAAHRHKTCIESGCEYASHVEGGEVRKCDKCGCGGMQDKIKRAQSKCPLKEPKWTEEMYYLAATSSATLSVG